jgi:hypothetical protein
MVQQDSSMVITPATESLTIKQARSQTVQNYIQYMTDFYEGFQVQPNTL